MVPTAAWALIAVGALFLVLACVWVCAAGTEATGAAFCGRICDCSLACAVCCREAARSIAYCCRGCREERRRPARVKDEDEGPDEAGEGGKTSLVPAKPPPAPPARPTPSLADLRREFVL